MIKILLILFICFGNLSGQDKYSSWYGQDTVSVGFDQPNSWIYFDISDDLKSDSVEVKATLYLLNPVGAREQFKENAELKTTKKESKMFNSDLYLFGLTVTGSLFIFIGSFVVVTVSLYCAWRFIVDAENENVFLARLKKSFDLDGEHEIIAFFLFVFCLGVLIVLAWPLFWFGLFGAIILYSLRFVVRASKGLKALSKVAHKHSDKGDIEEVEIGKVDWK